MSPFKDFQKKNWRHQMKGLYRTHRNIVRVEQRIVEGDGQDKCPVTVNPSHMIP